MNFPIKNSSQHRRYTEYESYRDDATDRQTREKPLKQTLSTIIFLLALALAGWQWSTAHTSGQQAQANLAEYAAKVKELVEHGVIKQPDMVPIPAGSFMMGSDPSESAESDEKPVHQVSIKAFKMGRFEVSFEEYDEFAASTGRPLPDDRGWGRGKRPVIHISRNDAAAYAQWLSEMTGKDFRLPTEAEWEYAARAGSPTAYFWEEEKEKPGNYAWYLENSGGRTHPVGEKQPNAFGLYDTAGNVWEWTCSAYTAQYLGNESQCANEADFGGVLRGGSGNLTQGFLRSAYRLRYTPVTQYFYLGFRLAQDL